MPEAGVEQVSAPEVVWRRLHERRGAAQERDPRAAVSRKSIDEIAAELNQVRPIRFIDVRRTEAFAAACSEHSLSPAAIRANLQLIRRHATGGPPVTDTQHPALIDGERFARFSIDILDRGQVSAQDPWTGEEVTSSSCISSPSAPYETVPVHGFRFGRERPFYLIFLGLVDCYLENFLYLPADELVFFSRGERNLEQLVSRWRAFCVRHEPTVSSYLRSVEAAKPAVLVRSLHFGHHVWNELSFLELLAASPAASRTTVIAARWPLGSIAAMYPELRVIELPSGQKLEEAHRFALQHGFFCAPCGRLRIPSALIGRLRSFAAAQCVDAAAEAEAFRRAHSPVLWVSVRSDQRVWLNQDVVLNEVLGVLLREHPRMGVIIDGFSWPLDLGPRFGFVAEEQAIARRIVEPVLSPDRTKVLIGRSLLESVAWTGSADAYLTHHGALRTRSPGLPIYRVLCTSVRAPCRGM